MEIEITSEDVESLLQKLSGYIRRRRQLDAEFDVDDDERLNNSISAPAEMFVWQALKARYPGSIHDGRVGRDDVVMPVGMRPLEVKLVGSDHGELSLQADVWAWDEGVERDILYLVRKDGSYDSWAVLLFRRLTKDLFGEARARGTKGKAPLRKHDAWNRCEVLFGTAGRKVKKDGGQMKVPCYTAAFGTVNPYLESYVDGDLGCVITVVDDEEDRDSCGCDEAGDQGPLEPDLPGRLAV